MAPVGPSLTSRRCLALHPVGFALPATSPSPRCALTAPFHPYLPGPRALEGGMFSVALSLSRLATKGWAGRWVLPTTAAGWCSDFPPCRCPQVGPAERPSTDRPIRLYGRFRPRAENLSRVIHKQDRDAGDARDSSLRRAPVTMGIVGKGRLVCRYGRRSLSGRLRPSCQPVHLLHPCYCLSNVRFQPGLVTGLAPSGGGSTSLAYSSGRRAGM